MEEVHDLEQTSGPTAPRSGRTRHAFALLGCALFDDQIKLAKLAEEPSEKFKPCSSENGDYFTQHIVFPTFYYQNKLLGVALSERLGKRP